MQNSAALINTNENHNITNTVIHRYLGNNPAPWRTRFRRQVNP